MSRRGTGEKSVIGGKRTPQSRTTGKKLPLAGGKSISNARPSGMGKSPARRSIQRKHTQLLHGPWQDSRLMISIILQLETHFHIADPIASSPALLRLKKSATINVPPISSFSSFPFPVSSARLPSRYFRRPRQEICDGKARPLWRFKKRLKRSLYTFSKTPISVQSMRGESQYSKRICS